MEDDEDIEKNDDTSNVTGDVVADEKIHVCLADEPSVSEEEVRRLLEEAGVSCSVEFVEDPNDVVFGPDDTVVLILEDGEGDQDQAACALKATQAGVSKIIGVWSPGATEQGIPLGTVRYGTDQVPWDPGKVGGVLKGDGACVFETPAGTPSVPNAIITNKCG